MIYFTFTTLATVGFGDYNPKADEERLFVVIIFLSGVSIFSYLMGIFIEILRKFQQLYVDLDDGDRLSLFFSLLRKMNGDKDIDSKLRKKIEIHFDNKWKTDRN